MRSADAPRRIEDGIRLALRLEEQLVRSPICLEHQVVGRLLRFVKEAELSFVKEAETSRWRGWPLLSCVRMCSVNSTIRWRGWPLLSERWEHGIGRGGCLGKQWRRASW